jgi:hypothetical protein
MAEVDFDNDMEITGSEILQMYNFANITKLQLEVMSLYTLKQICNAMYLIGSENKLEMINQILFLQKLFANGKEKPNNNATNSLSQTEIKDLRMLLHNAFAAQSQPPSML